MTADHRPAQDQDQAARLWQQADNAFDTLLDHPEHERLQRLADMHLPAGVHARVEQLLRSDSTAGPLDDPARYVTGLDTAVPTEDLSGRRIGGWILCRELGRGGMSVVYLAERKVGDGTQTAALKVLTVAALAGHGRERFMREQGILARLEHPAIAGLLDAGVLDDGTPWMVMARIDGTHIDQWCRQQRPGVRGIVRMFVEVCDTVDFAHRNLVIHRDIKPSNVLVDKDGHVHLLDFGIARLVDEELAQGTRTLAVTPRYAAPEQFAGADPATTMDVYGLGALLFCLLTGRPPPDRSHPRNSGPLVPASRACIESERHASHQKALRGDLDALLARALADEPGERYATPGDMADDLRNWLHGRPLRARRRGRVYRVRKFVGRHRIGVAATALLLITVLAGAGISLWQADVARHNAARANAVKDFMLQIFQASSPDKAAGKDRTASELLKRGAERVRHEFAGRPELRAQMLAVIGETQQQRGSIEDAEKTLDAALAAFAHIGRPSREYAAAIKGRASVDYDRSQLGDALTGLQRADRVAAAAGLDEMDQLRLDIRIQEANVHTVAQQPDQAVAMLKPLLSRLRHESGVEPYIRAYALEILGAALGMQHQSAEAIEALHQSARLARTLEKHPALLCDVLNDLAYVQYKARKFDQSVASSRKAGACSRHYYGENAQLTLATMSNLAAGLVNSGHPDEGAEIYARLMPVIRHVVGDDPSFDAAYNLAMMALARDAAGRDDALSAMRQALDEAQQLDQSVRNTAWITREYGLLLFERKRPDAGQYLGDYRDKCNTLDQLSRNRQRVCVAQLLLASDQAQCPLPSSAPAPEAMTDKSQRAWLAGYWLVRQRCARETLERHRAAARLQELLAPMSSLPLWLQARLADQKQSSVATARQVQ